MATTPMSSFRPTGLATWYWYPARITLATSAVPTGDLGAIVFQHVRHDVENRTCVVNDQHVQTVEPRLNAYGPLQRAHASKACQPPSIGCWSNEGHEVARKLGEGRPLRDSVTAIRVTVAAGHGRAKSRRSKSLSNAATRHRVAADAVL